MKVKLVNASQAVEYSDFFVRNLRFEDCACACDCDCACPIEGSSAPVLSLPVAYYLEITPLCNNRCPGCGNTYATERFSGPPSLTGGEWQSLIARLASHAHHMKITGGEPTLHPDFSAIISALGEHSISYTVFTNACWTQPKRVLDLLSTAPTCEGLLISLHGPDAATHEAFTGVLGSFAQTITNIRKAVLAGLDVAASIVITRHNWDQIEGTLALALELGANHLVCNRWIGAPSLDLDPEPADLRSVMATIESLRVDGYPIRFGNCIPQCFAPSSSTGCTAGTTFATIDPWGRMRPCNHAPLIAGDLRTQSLAEVWHGEVMNRWRAMVPGGCASCPAFSVCHGGCRAQALLANEKQDTLIQSVYPPPVPEAEIELWAGLRPVGQFDQRDEDGRLLLVHKSQVAIVPPEMYPLIQRLDGSLTLRHIQDVYSSDAVDWLGGLLKSGLVKLEVEEDGYQVQRT